MGSILATNTQETVDDSDDDVEKGKKDVRSAFNKLTETVKENKNEKDASKILKEMQKDWDTFNLLIRKLTIVIEKLEQSWGNSKEEKKRGKEYKNLKNDFCKVKKKTLEWKLLFAKELSESKTSVDRAIIETQMLQEKVKKLCKQIENNKEKEEVNRKKEAILDAIIVWGRKMKKLLITPMSRWGNIINDADSLRSEWKDLADSCKQLSVNVESEIQTLQKRYGKRNSLKTFFIKWTRHMGMILRDIAMAIIAYNNGDKINIKHIWERLTTVPDEVEVLQELINFCENQSLFKEGEPGNIDESHWELWKGKIMSGVNILKDTAEDHKKDVSDIKQNCQDNELQQQRLEDELPDYTNEQIFDNFISHSNKIINDCEKFSKRIDSIWELCLNGKTE